MQVTDDTAKAVLDNSYETETIQKNRSADLQKSII